MKPALNQTMTATVKHFYADLPQGTTGEIIKSWTDPQGCIWHKLYFGKNKSGKRLQKSVPGNCLEVGY